MKMNLQMLALVAGGGLIAVINSAFAQAWILTSAPITNWSSIAMSADGTKMVAGVADGPIYISVDSGYTWTNTGAPSANWSFVASSADGNTLAATMSVGPGCGLFTSTNAGLTWSQSSITDLILPVVAMSADGNRLIAVSANYGVWLYTTTNSGATWTFTNSPIIATTCIASSADCSRLVAGGAWAIEGWVYVSTNFGRSWISTGSTNLPYYSVASSADGRVLMAFTTPSFSPQVFVSTNSGANWKAANLPRSDWVWNSACSMDGSTLVAAGLQTPLSGRLSLFYTSTNSGAAWNSVTPPGTNACLVAISADGKRLAASVIGGGIYTWQTTPHPVLNVTVSGDNLLLSWIIPSEPFVLQENADLAMANWRDVTTPPAVNFTNLEHQVAVPLTNGNRFYRLKAAVN
jgi:hypothetical protein